MAAPLVDPPFRRVAIVGLGLIGGSIALAVRECWPGTRLTGVDAPAVLAHVVGSGAIDRAVTRVAEVGAVDLVVLAAPVHDNRALLAELAVHAPRPAVVTDVGSTKRDIVEAAAGLPVAFIGGHPIGGAEQGGFAFARADLFAGHPWILTPSGDTAAEPLTALRTWVEGFGARPTVLDPAAHDRLVAFLSHLPQLTAGALMATVGEAVGADGLRLAGRGLIDTTRLAGSPANIWRDICATNADAIGEALDALIEQLTVLRTGLAAGAPVDHLFAGANRWRSELLKRRG